MSRQNAQVLKYTEIWLNNRCFFFLKLILLIPYLLLRSLFIYYFR